MADSNPEQLSTRDVPTATDMTEDSSGVRTRPVSLTGVSKVVGKTLQNDSVLPNGCVKHTFEGNGVLKVVKNAENCKCISDNDTMCGNLESETVARTFHDNESTHTNCLGSEEGEGPNVENSQDSCNINDGHSATEFISDLSAESEICDSLAKATISDNDNKSSQNSEPLQSGVDDSVLPVKSKDLFGGIEYVVYESELQMPEIMRLITKDLSEPYSIYTYRYFIHNWPKLCFLAMEGQKCVGAIVCKLDMHKKMVRRGYIAMLAVDENARRRGIGSHLVMKAIRAMVSDDCDEVVLETEITNKAALRLYENLGFVRDKRLFRYYLNGVDALRLKLWLR